MTSRNVFLKLEEDWKDGFNSAAVNQLYDAGETTPAGLSVT
jgi:hypothetical protein